MYTVYKHTAPNGKVYIGITGQKPEKRWKHGNGYKDNEHFYRAILKYGWENIKHEIVCTGLTKRQAGKVEQSLIKYFDSTNHDKGYNNSIGGEYGALGMHHSVATRKKLSKSHKGKPSPRKGAHLSAKTRQKISEAHKGKYPGHGWEKGNIPWNKGKKGKYHLCDVTRKRMSEANKGNAVKAVICVETGALYDSGVEAAKSIGVTNRAISNVVRGVNKTCGGYHWKYAEDMEESK